jgi:hypothetical protein
MVINDLHLIRSLIGPNKTKAIFPVNSDTVLPQARAGQGLKVVPRRDPKLRQGIGGVQKVKLAGRQLPQEPWANLTRGLSIVSIEDVFRALVPE